MTRTLAYIMCATVQITNFGTCNTCSGDDGKNLGSYNICGGADYRNVIPCNIGSGADDTNISVNIIYAAV